MPVVQPETIVITPHAYQAKVLYSKKRFCLALAGIQGGKTYVGCIWLQMEIQKQPTKDHLVCALSHDQLNNVLINKFFNMFPPYKKYYNKGDKTIYLPTGGKVFFRSLEDPKYVEGITAYSAWIDEADLVGFNAYLIVRGRLNATGGRMLMTSSISDNSWLADYMSKMDEKEFDIISWGSKENPSFSKEEWESLKRELDPSLFRRRYEAELSFSTGRVYSNFNYSKHVVESFNSEKESVKKTFIGIDWGYVDPTAILLMCVTQNGNVYVMDEFVVEGAPIDIICDVINKFIARAVSDYKIHPIIYADPSNKLFLKSVSMNIRQEIIPGNRGIFEGTSKVRNLIWQNRFFIFSKCKSTLKEIKLYRFKEKNWERKEEPEMGNDHTMDALRYVIASYPLSTIKERQNKRAEDLSDFWARRTPAYKRESNKNNSYNLPSDIWNY